MDKIKFISRIKAKIERIPKPVLLIISGTAVVLTGVLDFSFNSQYNIFLIYLFPVIFISWTRGRYYGIIISLFAIAVWIVSEILSNNDYIILNIIIINTGLRLAVLFSIIYIISILNKLLKNVRDESRIDYLTNISNTRAFFESAEIEINHMKRSGRALTIAYIDLDNFKKVNDTKGHLEGNRLLKTVAQNIRQEIRGMDIFARVGGDEFILLLPETNKDQAGTVIDKIISSLDHIMKQNNWPVTFSVGVLIVDRLPDSIDKAVKAADDLMYRAKKSGKNRVIYKEF